MPFLPEWRFHSDGDSAFFFSLQRCHVSRLTDTQIHRYMFLKFKGQESSAGQLVIIIRTEYNDDFYEHYIVECGLD